MVFPAVIYMKLAELVVNEIKKTVAKNIHQYSIFYPISIFERV